MVIYDKYHLRMYFNDPIYLTDHTAQACRMILNLREIHNEPTSTVSLSVPVTFVRG